MFLVSLANGFALHLRPHQIRSSLNRMPDKWQEYNCRERSEPRLPLTTTSQETRPTSASAS